MAVQIVNDTLLKPSPWVQQNPHTNARIPLTIFDRAAFDLHVTILYAFRPPMPSNEALMQGLADALNIYPHLAGRFAVDEQGRPCIVLNGAGVRIVETEITGTTLSEQLPFEPSHELTNLHPPTEGAVPVLQIQLNRYACGGLVIGQTAHHRVADGQSMSGFFAAWARLVRGLPVDALPFHNRAAVSVPRNPPACEFNHRAIEFREALPAAAASTPPPVSSSNIVNLVIHYPAEFVNGLKKRVCQGGSRYSTFECLLTHMWKKLTLARGLGGDETTQVRVAVNGRARMRPAVPMEYFGNLVLWAYPRMTVKNLVAGSHASVAREIHDAVASVDAAYFQSFVDFGAQLSKEDDLDSSAAAMGNVLCPNLEVDSWLRFEFHELDFGGGAPCAFLPAELPVEGLFLFVPSYKEKGSVDVFVAVAEDHVDTFKQVAYSLD